MPKVTQYYITVSGAGLPADPSYVKDVSPLAVDISLSNAYFWDNDKSGRDTAMNNLISAYPQYEFVGGSRPKP